MVYADSLPWSADREEQRRLRSVSVLVIPLFLLAALYVTWVQLPEPDRREREALPPQLAKLIVQKQEPPRPVVPEVRPEPKPEPKPESKPEPKPVAAPEPRPEPRAPRPEPKPEVRPEPAPEAVAQAREKARNTGILAMGNELSRLSQLASSVKLDEAPATRTAAVMTRKTDDALARRALASKRSAGVDEQSLTRNTTEVALAERTRAQVQDTRQVAAVEREVRKQQTASAARTRSREELRRTMDANKAAIYSIYNRELRRKPSLQGRITPELVIEPDGAVSACSVVESTLNEPALERKICNRLRLVNFGAKPGVERTTIRYPIELLPG